MHSSPDFVSRVLRGLSRLVTMALLGAVVLSLLLLGVCAALLSVLWSLLRGKKPAMFAVFQTFRQASHQFRPGSGPWSAPAQDPGDVVDVQAHEVRKSLNDSSGG